MVLDSIPREVLFAEIVISEIKRMLCIIYAALFRYYYHVVDFEVLNEMKEDLIETITSTMIKGELSRMIIILCKFSTKNEQ